MDYRRPPEHPFPAAVDDALAATRWATEHAAELGTDPARIAVGFAGAGGNLAALASRLALASGGPRLVLQLLLDPVTDVSRKRPSYRLFGEASSSTRQTWTGTATVTCPIPAPSATREPRR